MIVNLKSETNLSGFYLVYEGSTNLEKKGSLGVGHLSEHLMCRAFTDLEEEFDRDGINWNAYTSSNEIVFYLTGLDEKVNKYKKVFVELISNYKVSKEEFEHEKKIVLEEYMDCFNDQTQAHLLNLSRKLFNDFDPIGLKSDLENLTFEDFQEFYELQYSKPSKIINVSKNSEYNEPIEFISRKFDTEFKYGNHNVELELNNDFKDKTSVIVLSPIINEDFAYVSFINSMLSLGLSSPLYQEVREKKGLVYYIHCYISRVNDKGINTISTLTSNKNYDEVVDTIKDVLDNPDLFLTQDRMNLVRDYYLVRKQKDEINRYNTVGQWISPSGWNIYDILDEVNLDKIKEVYSKYFKFEDMYVSNDKTEFL